MLHHYPLEIIFHAGELDCLPDAPHINLEFPKMAWQLPSDPMARAASLLMTRSQGRLNYQEIKSKYRKMGNNYLSFYI